MQLTHVLLSMHVPESARHGVATRVYKALLAFKKLGVPPSEIRIRLGSNPSGVRSRLRSGR